MQSSTLQDCRVVAGAVAWQIWRQHRIGLLAVGTLILLTSAAAWITARRQSGTGFAESLGYTVLALSVLAVFVFFHFTEGDRKAGFGRFPARLFILPVSTVWLVAWPMLQGSVSVVAVYLLASTLIFRPLGISLPVTWPCLYLVGAFSLYQTILWSVPNRRLTKLFLLSLTATGVLLGWMFFIPSVVEGTLADWGYEGIRTSFLRGLFALLCLIGPTAYLVSFYSIHRQRHDTGRRRWMFEPERFYDLLQRKRTPYSSIGSALFWTDWRRSGLILPAATLLVLALTCVPAGLSGPLSASATTGILFWILAAPLGLSAVIGCGFCKPDFWRTDLSLSPFLSVRPMNTSSWVTAKVIVAAGSVTLTWILAGYGLLLWVGYAANYEAIDKLWSEFRIYVSRSERLPLVLLSILVLWLLSTRLLLGPLASGLSGHKGWFYTSSGLVMMCLAAVPVLLVWRSDGGDGALRLYDVWTVIRALPLVLVGLALIKVWVAASAWKAAVSTGVLETNKAVLWLSLLSLSVIAWVSWAHWVVPNTAWLKHLLSLSALLWVPFAALPLAMLMLKRNRSGQENAPLMNGFIAARSFDGRSNPGDHRRSAGVSRYLLGGGAIILLGGMALYVYREIPRQVRIEDRKVRVAVTGSGAPAVIFDTFGPAPLEVWNKVQPRVSQFATTVTYDHPGYYGSEPGDKPRDADRIATELHALLGELQIPPPYLLVGYSFGGPYLRVFASKYPRDVAGLVLVDPTQEAFMDEIARDYPELTRISPTARAAQREEASVWESLQQARESKLPNAPLTLLTGMKSHDALSRHLLPKWLAAHRSWLASYSHAEHWITTNSGHGIPITEPELVVKAIRNMAESLNTVPRNARAP